MSWIGWRRFLPRLPSSGRVSQQLAIDLSGSLVEGPGCRLAYPDERTKHHWPGWPSCHTVDRLPGQRQMLNWETGLS